METSVGTNRRRLLGSGGPTIMPRQRAGSQLFFTLEWAKIPKKCPLMVKTSGGSVSAASGRDPCG